MALSNEERMIVEAISSLLKQKAHLGLPIADAPKESAHLSQFRWEGIDDAFALKVAGSPFADSITSAFFAVHSHKYIDNPTFKLSFDREMQARAIPTEEKEHAFKYLEKLTEELSEKDAGWNPHMDEIADLTSNADNRQPKTSKPFTGGGPAPEGERGGKGGAYMEGMNRVAEDSNGNMWVLHDSLARCVDTGEVINDVEKIKDKFKNANVIELG